VFIELDKFKTPLDENATLAEKWLHVLQSAHTYEDIPKYLQEEVFTEAFRVLDKTKWKEKEMKNYSLELQREEERKDSIAYEVRLAVEKATKQATTEGELKGELKGKLKGKLEIISNMLEAGMNAAQIAKLTKISEEEIEKLKH
jgi:predicted transposase/invertase (TIGR01784 family)